MSNSNPLRLRRASRFTLTVALGSPLLLAGGAPADARAGWKPCRNTVHGYTIAYPERWHTTHLRRSDRCTLFDPRRFEVIAGSEPPLTALGAHAVSQSQRQVVRSMTESRYYVVRRRENVRIHGRRAVLVETVSTGEGLFPRRTRFYGYVLARGGKSFVVQTSVPPGRRGYARFKRVVDRAVRTVRFAAAGASRRSIRVYFTNARRRRDANSCGKVFARSRTVAGGGSIERLLERALDQLLAGPSPHERARDYSSWFSTATAGALRGARVLADRTVRIDFEDLSRIIPSASSSCGSSELLAALGATVRAIVPGAVAVYSFRNDCAKFSDWLQAVAPGSCPAVRRRR